jgi:parallel beta-helix repeat protein
MGKSAAFLVTIAVTLILISLLTLSVVCVQPVKTEDQGNITINADGSITPSTAPIQHIGNTYTLTGDVHGSITVMRSNTTFDGNGRILTGGQGVGGLSVGCNYYSSTTSVGASNVTVKNLTVKGSVFGISLVETTNALIFNNTISETRNGPFQPTAGIYVSGGGSNIIRGNSLINNFCGMSLVETQNSLIIENNIENNSNPAKSGYGIVSWSASNNTIYHNNFVNNDVQAYNDIFDSPFSINIWDDGYGGNYWSDYRTKYPNAAEIRNSKIGDTAYVIDSENRDRYPLTDPFVAPPQITLLSPVNQLYNESSIDLVFLTNEAVNWTGYSLDGRQNVTVTGNSTITGIPNGSHSLVVYANDSLGNMGSSENLTFSVAVAAPAPLVLVSAGLGIAVLVVGVGLFYYVKKRLAASKGR